MTVDRKYGQIVALAKLHRFECAPHKPRITHHHQLKKLDIIIFEHHVIEHKIGLDLEPDLFFYAQYIAYLALDDQRITAPNALTGTRGNDPLAVSDDAEHIQLK